MEATLTEVQVPCPSCTRPMSSIENSWQCLACHPIPVDIPKCKTQICKRPLTRLDEPWNCWICLKCNKHPKEVNKAMAEKQIEQHPHRYVKDHVSHSELDELVAKKVAEILAEQRPAYPPTQAEIRTMTEPILQNAKPEEKPETWLQKAKRLGVATHIPTGGMRKKTEIMADIERVEKGNATVNEIIDGAVAESLEESVAEAKAFREAAQNPPSKEDEFARGLTEEDML